MTANAKGKSRSTSIDSQTFGQICNEVWRDREAILSRRGIITGEAALVRAVYWRLCKLGGAPGKSIDDCDSVPSSLTYQLVVGSMLELCAQPRFDGAPILNELVHRYHEEGAERY
jgi:hypothetical protein